MSISHQDRLRLRHLRLLELIEQHGSLRSVADVLNLSQPAISQMLKDLELAFGTQLVERSVRGVELNAAGRTALLRSRPCLSFVRQLGEELESPEQPVLRVGANPAVMLHVIPQAIRRMFETGPRMRFRFRAGLVAEMVEALVAGDIDCYVGRVDWSRISREAAGMLVCSRLSVAELSVACAADHPLTRKDRVTPQDLLTYPWASAAGGSSNWAEVQLRFRELGLKPPAAEIESDLLGLLGIAAATDFLTCAPISAIRHPMSAKTLTALHVPGFELQPAQTEFVSLLPPERLTPMHRLLEALRAEQDNGESGFTRIA
ncbi:LysR family transcriptional regulator [Chachezhania antarctica]|uniref:LysR family transcriptional regulator n=1 Tax=Chachezhania antarctica TaxID=2340860 RepID=UPI000EB25860|nr:LysR family transcriptional regulator [Chachezhania antarctica]|tara:strand:- start:3727 stop:4677 length:951 start_codon:yes stop_codon:yes gene_type:complete